MRIAVLAGSGLSLLLACTVVATAQQRPTTCVDRTQQVKKAQDQLAVLVPQVTAQKVRCTSATDDRRRQECMAYGVSLTLQRKQESDLKALTDDPAWRACSVSAGGGTRYSPASVTPSSSTPPGGGQTSPANSGQNSPATVGQGSGGGGGQSGSGTGGSGISPGSRGFGSASSGGGGIQSGGGGMQSGRGGTQMSSVQGGNCGSPGCSSTQSKGGTSRGEFRHKNSPGTRSNRSQQTAWPHRGGFGSSHHGGGFGSSHHGGHSGRSSSHGRRR
jgi:hypothetical protein